MISVAFFNQLCNSHKLTLTAHTVLKLLKKMQTILLYLFAAQQQISTFRRQKIGLFYLKFSAKCIELSLNF